MKKYFTIILALFLTAFGIFYAVSVKGVYVDLRPNDPVTASFMTEEEKIFVQKADGEYEEVVIRGVELSSSMPGQYATQFAAEEEDYLRWLEAIGEMGANTVRVYNIMDDDFYNAFYRYNTEHETPLYLLQGLQVSDDANFGSQDAWADDFYGSLLEDAEMAVDVIHGKRIINTNEMQGTGIYSKDISQWVLGYIVGQEWDASTVAYTDEQGERKVSGQGTYFTTTEDATTFERLLADVMDRIVSYESWKYKEQRLVSFANDPSLDPFEYETSYASQLGKFCSIDAEHILPTEKLISGYFASYKLYDFCDNFAEYLSAEQKSELGTILTDRNSASSFQGYLDVLEAYHTMPVVVTGYGFSTARIPVEDDQLPLTEEEQGEALMEVYHEALEAGWNGVCISTWQDVWERRTWNTAFSTVPTQNYLWHDLQSDGQNYGILDFEPGEEEKVCYVDGDSSEWDKSEPVLTTDAWTVFTKQDEEGLYLLISGEGVQEQPLYIPIDTTQQSGSSICDAKAVEFDRAADFLLCLDGTDNTRLLVQERYDALRENFLEEITGENPFYHFPGKDSSTFVTIGTALRNDTLIDETLLLTEEEAQKLKALGVWESGKLVHGDGNPEHDDYLSLADFCFGESCVEICLPWGLLNVGDPSQMMIHSDYYENYGVDMQHVSTFYIGIGNGSEKITMEPVKMPGYKGAPVWHERLKESYDVIQKEWKGENNASSGH